MGRVLQVRVSAWTFDEKDVRKQWPALCGLVWKEEGEFLNAKRGVEELAEAVQTACEAGLLPDEQIKALEKQAADAYSLLEKLRSQLGDWEAKEADKTTYALEDALDGLENTASKF